MSAALPPRSLAVCLAAFLSLGLVACGGGGGGGGGAPTTPATPSVPLFGVHRVNHANLTASDSSAINHPYLNGNPAAQILVTANYKPPGARGVYNDHPVGVWYDLSTETWQIINLDRGPLEVGSAFNVRVVTGNVDTFLWNATAATISRNNTKIVDPHTDGKRDAVLLVTQNWNPGGGGGTFNPNVIAVHGGGSPDWYILNQDPFVPFPDSTYYNVSARTEGPKDFVHVSSRDSIVGNSTVLSHPLLDGNPDATMQVTQYWIGTNNIHHIGVWYDGASWRIFNQDVATMTPGATFMVSID